jgi:hypothetical protein
VDWNALIPIVEKLALPGLTAGATILAAWQRGALAAKDATIAAKDAALAAKDATIAAKNDHISLLERTIKGKDDERAAALLCGEPLN